jgi:serine/threonine protein kinase
MGESSASLLTLSENTANARSNRGPRGMKIEAAAAFRDALLGLKGMHNANWLHRDLKPTNIGTIGTPARCVLLDVGTSAYLRPGSTLQPHPGEIGTIGFLAPELELEAYDHSIDILAMGIILYYLTYGCHPFKYAINPWCKGKDNEKLRPAFQESYRNAVDKMSRDYNSSRQSPTDGYIHRRRSNFYAHSF